MLATSSMGLENEGELETHPGRAIESVRWCPKIIFRREPRPRSEDAKRSEPVSTCHVASGDPPPGAPPLSRLSSFFPRPPPVRVFSSVRRFALTLKCFFVFAYVFVRRRRKRAVRNVKCSLATRTMSRNKSSHDLQFSECLSGDRGASSNGFTLCFRFETSSAASVSHERKPGAARAEPSSVE